MKLEPFLLDQWLEQKSAEDSPIEFDLGSSTGPRWAVSEVLGLAGRDEQRRLLDTPLVYSRGEGADALREAIAGLCGAEPRHVQVVTGASEALLITFFLAAEPGANVVLPAPCFPPMAAVPAALGLEVRSYVLRRENHFRVDPDEVRSLIDGRTKLLLVNSPHNPTGATVSDAEMSALHELAAVRGVQFVSDEVYHPIFYGRETASAARLPHATVVGSTSKAMSLSGLRVGWLVERDARRMTDYLNARQYFTISNAPLAESFAALALRGRETVWGRTTEVANVNLRLLDRFFAESSDVLGWVRPRGGLTAFPWLKSGADARGFCQKMAARGVLLVPGDCFGAPPHFRLGFGMVNPEKMPEALRRLADGLRA